MPYNVTFGSSCSNHVSFNARMSMLLDVIKSCRTAPFVTAERQLSDATMMLAGPALDSTPPNRSRMTMKQSATENFGFGLGFDIVPAPVYVKSIRRIWRIFSFDIFILRLQTTK